VHRLRIASWLVLGLSLLGPAEQVRAQNCDSVPFSRDEVGLQTIVGLPGDTIWAPVWAITDSTLIAFRMVIQFDSTILRPLFAAPGSDQLVVEPAGRFAGSVNLAASLSEAEIDSGAIAVVFLPFLNSNDTIPAGRGVILRIPFVVQQEALFAEYSLIRFPRRTVYLVDSSSAPPDSTAICRGTDFVERSGGPSGMAEGFPRPSTAYFFTDPDPAGPPRIEYFGIDPRSAWQGDTVQAVWSVRNADSIVLAPAVGMHPGSVQTEPFEVVEGAPTTYTLTAFGRGAPVSRTLRLLAVPPGANRFPYWQYYPEPVGGPVLSPIRRYLWAIDPDGDEPTFSSPNLPPGAVLIALGGGGVLFEWTPSAADTGYRAVSILTHDALDSARCDSLNLEIYVRDANFPPTYSYDSSDRMIFEGDTLRIPIAAADPNGTIPSIAAHLHYADTLAANMSFVDSGNGAGLLTFLPSYFQGNLAPTYYLVSFTIRDAVDPALTVATAPVRIYVQNRNSGLGPPVLSLSAGEGPFTVAEEDSLVFELTAATSTGDIPVISASALPPTASLTDYPGATAGDHKIFRFKPADGMVGEYRVTFYAANVDLIDSAAVDLAVVARNHPPVIMLLPGNDVIFEEDTARVRVLAFDPDSVPSVLTAYLDGTDTLARNMTMVDSGNGAGVLTFVPNRVQGSPCGPVFYYLRFRATDPIPPHPSVISSVRTIRVYDSGLPCCIGRRGDVNYDSNGLGAPTVADLTGLIAFVFRPGAPLPCYQEGDFDSSGAIGVVDITTLIGYLFQGGPPPTECPAARSPGDSGPGCRE